MEKGNIIAEYHYKCATVYISDAYSSKLTPEERAAARRNAARTAGRILRETLQLEMDRLMAEGMDAQSAYKEAEAILDRRAAAARARRAQILGLDE